MEFNIASNEDLCAMISMSDYEFKEKLQKHRESVESIVKYLKNEIPLDLFCTEETIKSVSEERVHLIEGVIARSLYDDDSNSVDIDVTIDTMMHCIFGDYPDFFTAPASTMYHGDWIGGLCDHSLAVLEAAYGMADTHLSSSLGRIVKLPPLWFILHDICKCNCYERTTKNRKNPETNKWETVECWATKKDYISGPHGDESVNRIYQMLLKYPSELDWMSAHFVEGWRLAISYHMGLYNVSDGDMINYNNAKRKYPVVLLMHHADMVASQIWGF